MAQSNALFKQAGLSGSGPTIATVLMDLVNSLCTLPAVPLIERVGRRALLVVGTAGMTISVLPAAICYWIDSTMDATTWLGIVGCVVFVIFFAFTYGPVLWVYLFEIYPLEIKGPAAGLATAWNWIAGIVMVYLSNYLSNTYNFTLFTILCFVSFLVVFTFMKETKGRLLGDSPYITKREDRV